ncbi:unnamed protein product [Malus baccata var. baccata]
MVNLTLARKPLILLLVVAPNLSADTVRGDWIDVVMSSHRRLFAATTHPGSRWVQRHFHQTWWKYYYVGSTAHQTFANMSKLLKAIEESKLVSSYFLKTMHP